MALYKQGNTDAQIKIGGGKLFGVFVSSTSSGTFACTTLPQAARLTVKFAAPSRPRLAVNTSVFRPVFGSATVCLLTLRQLLNTRLFTSKIFRCNIGQTVLIR